MNSSLPVHLTSSNVKQNPEFAKLLTSLTRHLTNTGMSLTVHKDLMQVGDNRFEAGLCFGHFLSLFLDARYYQSFFCLSLFMGKGFILLKLTTV